MEKEDEEGGEGGRKKERRRNRSCCDFSHYSHDYYHNLREEEPVGPLAA